MSNEIPTTRPGAKFVCEILPGQTIMFLPQGSFVIAHPDHPPRLYYADEVCKVLTVAEPSKDVTMSEDAMVARVARALMNVTARRPGDKLGREIPVLALDPDFDDLPRDHTEGTEDDDITQEAVLRLARAAIEAMRDPLPHVLEAFSKWALPTGNLEQGWEAAIDAALNSP